MKEKESENLEKEDPKFICSACQIFANIFKKHFSKHSACIQTFSEIGQNVFGFIAFLLYLEFLCSSSTTKLLFKNSNLLLQKRIRDSKYIPPKYIRKKVYNSEILKKEEANFIYQRYKGQDKLGKFIITKENQRKRCSKNSSEK